MTTTTNRKTNERRAKIDGAMIEIALLEVTLSNLRDALDDAFLAIHYAANNGDDLPVTAKDLAGTRKKIDAIIAQITGDAVQAAVKEMRS